MNPTDSNQLDPSVVALTRAIGNQESGGNYSKIGDNGHSIGAYQWNNPTPLKQGEVPANFKDYANNVGADSNDFSPENQDRVAYATVLKWGTPIEQGGLGLNPAQIASKWNSGDPNAYQSAKAGYNAQQGVRYDTASYVNNVAKYYQQYFNQINQPNQSQNETSPQQQDILQKTGNVVNAIFPGKQVGESIGTLGGLALEKLKGLFGGQDNSQYYDTSAPSPLQTLGDVGQGALMVGAGLPAEGATSVAGKAALGATKNFLPAAATSAGRIAQAGLLGSALGGTGAIAAGANDINDIAKQGIIGAATGGILGGAGELVNKIASSLPSRLVNNFIPKISDETTQYAINKGLGSPAKMLADSDTSIKSLGNKLGSILSKPEYEGINITGQDLYGQFIQENPKSGILPDDFFNQLKKVSGLKAGLVDQLATSTGLSLPELQSLNSEIGKNTFKSVLDTPEVRTGKQLGSSVYHAIGDAIRTIAPEDGRTAQIYSDLSKEYQLNNGLQRTLTSERKSKFISLRDLMGITGGFSTAGPMGALTGYGIMRASENPTLNLRAAGLLSNLAKQNAKTIGKGLLPLAVRQVTNATRTPSQ